VEREVLKRKYHNCRFCGRFLKKLKYEVENDTSPWMKALTALEFEPIKPITELEYCYVCENKNCSGIEAVKEFARIYGACS